MERSGAMEKDLNYYYETYKPDRLRAVMALRVDTGMDSVRAQQEIDFIFDFHEGRQKGCEAAASDAILRCPQCGSEDIESRKSRKSSVHIYGRPQNSVLRLVTSIVRLISVIEERKQPVYIEHKCRECKLIWFKEEN